MNNETNPLLSSSPTTMSCPGCGARAFTLFPASPVSVDLETRTVGHSPCEDVTEIFCPHCGEIEASSELWDAVKAVWDEAPEPGAWQITHSHTIKWTNFGGSTNEVTCTGNNGESASEVRTAAYRSALKSGWTPPKWWQWWRWGDTRFSPPKFRRARITDYEKLYLSFPRVQWPQAEKRVQMWRDLGGIPESDPLF